MDAEADGPKPLRLGRKATTRLSMAGGLLAFIAAAVPMAPEPKRARKTSVPIARPSATTIG
jgi:hypothetical protein